MILNTFMFVTIMYKMQSKCRVEEDEKSYNQNSAFILDYGK